MEKTLRETCLWAIDEIEKHDGMTREVDDAMMATLVGEPSDTFDKASDLAAVRSVLGHLDAERAAVLEEVRAWLEERAGELGQQLAADHHDSYKHGGADEVRVLTYRFTRRFLASKEGA